MYKQHGSITNSNIRACGDATVRYRTILRVSVSVLGGPEVGPLLFILIELQFVILRQFMIMRQMSVIMAQCDMLPPRNYIRCVLGRAKRNFLLHLPDRAFLMTL